MSADMGIDPATQQPMEMPAGYGVDPQSPAPDPMLDIHGGEQDYEPVEVEKREKVEYQLLCAIERCASGVDIGTGSQNKDFATAYGQAAASLAQAYSLLQGAEMKEHETGARAVQAASSLVSAAVSAPVGNE